MCVYVWRVCVVCICVHVCTFVCVFLHVCVGGGVLFVCARVHLMQFQPV
jgi:hypothetical protein